MNAQQQFPKLRPTLLLMATTLSLGACSGRPGTLPSEPALQATETASLAIGQSALFTNGRELRVSFESVDSDSRCPADVQCVWSGDAEIRLRLELSGPGASATPRVMYIGLHTTLQPQRVIVSDAFAIRLVSVSPDNQAGTPIPASAYRATIEVTAP